MADTTDFDFSAFKSRLSPSAFAFFLSLFENAREKIIKEGPQETYEKPLELIEHAGDIEAVADTIKKIIQIKIECKQQEYLYFFPFVTSICIEGGIVKYSLPPEIEKAMPRLIIPS